MLKKSTTESVAPLVAKLGVNGISLSAKPGTPLAAVSEFCISTSDFHDSPAVALEDIVEIGAQMVKETSANNVFNENVHDQAMDTVVEAGVKVLNDNNQIARNVVNPIVSKAFDRTQELIEQSGHSAINPLSIVPVKTDGFWNSNALSSMIDPYVNAPLTDGKIERWWGPVEYDEIFNLIRTGSSSFDNEIQAYLERTGKDSVKTVYQEFFQGVVHDVSHTKITEYLNIHRNIRDVLLVHLIARSLKRDIPAGLKLARVVYDSYMLLVIEQSARVLNRLLEKQRFYTSNKILVLNYPSFDFEYVRPQDGIIQVNGDIYDNWLEAGGSPEVIFGAFVSGAYRTEGRGYQSLLDNAESFKASWRRQYNLLVAHQNTLIYNTTISAMRKAIAEAIVDLNDEYVVVTSRGEYQQRLTDALTKVTNRVTDNLFVVVRKVVCEVLFAHTNALEILEAIDHHSAVNPEIDVREAALFANIDAVANWLFTQIDVTTFEANR